MIPALATAANVAAADRKLLSASSSARPEIPERDIFPAAGLADMVDRSLHASVGRLTAGLSPAALALAYLDWTAHIAVAPGKRIALVDKAVRKAIRLFEYMCRCGFEDGRMAPCIEPLPQ